MVLGSKADKTAALVFKFIDEDGGGTLDQVEFFRFLGFDTMGRPLAFNPLQHLLAEDDATGGAGGRRGLHGALYRMWNAVLRWSGGGLGVVGAGILFVRGAFTVHDPQRSGTLSPERFEFALRTLPGHELLLNVHVKELKQRHLDTDDEGRRVVNYDEFVHALALDDDAVVDAANDFRLQVRSAVQRGGEDARKKMRKQLDKMTSSGKRLTGVAIQESLKKHCDVTMGTSDIRALVIGYCRASKMSSAVDPALVDDFVECFVSDLLESDAFAALDANVVTDVKIVYWTSEDHAENRGAGYDMLPLDLSRFAAAAAGGGETRAALPRPCHIWVKRSKRSSSKGKALSDVALVNELMCGNVAATRSALRKEGFSPVGVPIGPFQLFVKKASKAKSGSSEKKSKKKNKEASSSRAATSSSRKHAATEPIVDVCVAVNDPSADDSASSATSIDAPSMHHAVARRFDVPCAHLWLRRRPSKLRRDADAAAASLGLGPDGTMTRLSGADDPFAFSSKVPDAPGLSNAAVTETLRRCVVALRAHFRDSLPTSNAEEWALGKFGPDSNGLVEYAAFIQATRTRGIFDARRLTPEERDALLNSLDPMGYGTVQGDALVALLRSDKMPVMRRNRDDRWGIGVSTRVSVDYHESGRRYPATIVAVHSDGTYGVLYDDNERERVPLSRITVAPARDAIRIGGVYASTVRWKGGVLMARVVSVRCATGLGRADFSAPWCELSVWPSDDAKRAGPALATPFARTATSGNATWDDADRFVRLRVWPPPPSGASSEVPRPQLALKLRRRWLRGVDGHVEEVAAGVMALSDVLYDDSNTLRRTLQLNDGDGEVELELKFMTPTMSGARAGVAPDLAADDDVGGVLQVRVIGMDGLGLEGGGGGRSASWSASPFVIMSLPWASARARARVGPFQHNRVKVKRQFKDLFTVTAVAAETTPAVASPSITVGRLKSGDSGEVPVSLGAPITRWYGSLDFSANSDSEVVMTLRDGAKEVGTCSFTIGEFLAGDDAQSRGRRKTSSWMQEKKMALLHGAEKAEVGLLIVRLRKQGEHEWFQETPVECSLPFDANECARGAAQTLGRWEGEKSLEATLRVCRHTTLAAGASVEHDTLATATVHFAPLFRAGVMDCEWTSVTAPLRLQHGVGAAAGGERRGKGDSGGKIVLDVRFRPTASSIAPSIVDAFATPVRWMRVRIDLISGTDLSHRLGGGTESGALALYVKVFAQDGITELPLCSETIRGDANPRWDQALGLIQVRSRSDSVQLHLYNDVARTPVLLGVAKLAVGETVWGLNRNETQLKLASVTFTDNTLGRVGYLRLRLTVASIARASSKTDAGAAPILPGTTMTQRDGFGATKSSGGGGGGGSTRSPSRSRLSDEGFGRLLTRLTEVMRATERSGLVAEALYRQYDSSGRGEIAETAFVDATKVLLKYQEGHVTEAQLRELGRRCASKSFGLVDTRKAMRLLGCLGTADAAVLTNYSSAPRSPARAAAPIAAMTLATTRRATAAVAQRPIKCTLAVEHVVGLRPPRDPSSTLVVALHFGTGERIEHSSSTLRAGAPAPIRGARSVGRSFGFTAQPHSTVAIELAWRDLYGRMQRIGLAEVQVFQELNCGARMVLLSPDAENVRSRMKSRLPDVRLSISITSPELSPRAMAASKFGGFGSSKSGDGNGVTLQQVLMTIQSNVVPATLWAAFGARDAHATGVVENGSFREVMLGLLPHRVVEEDTLTRVADAFRARGSGMPGGRSGRSGVDFVEFCSAVSRANAEASGARGFAPHATWGTSAVDGAGGAIVGGGGSRYVDEALATLRRWAADHHHTVESVSATLLQGTGAVSVPRARLRRRLESLGVRLSPQSWEALMDQYRSLGHGAHGVDAARLAVDAVPVEVASKAPSPRRGRLLAGRGGAEEVQRSTSARWKLIDQLFDDAAGLGWREALDDLDEAFEGEASLSSVRAFHAALQQVVRPGSFTVAATRALAADARWCVASASESGESSKDRVDVARFIERVPELTPLDLATLARRAADAASLGSLVRVDESEEVASTLLRALEPFDGADEGLVSHLEVFAVLQRHGVPLSFAEVVMLCLHFKGDAARSVRHGHQSTTIHRLSVRYERLIATLFG